MAVYLGVTRNSGNSPVPAAKHYQMSITVKNEAVVLDRRANEKHRDSLSTNLCNISGGNYLDVRVRVKRCSNRKTCFQKDYFREVILLKI